MERLPDKHIKKYREKKSSTGNYTSGQTDIITA